METILFSIIAAILSSYLTYYFSKKSKKNEAILKFKEEKYSNLLIHLQGFIGNTASGETKKKFIEEQYKSWLYCSDTVVTAINAMLDTVPGPGREETKPIEDRNTVGDIVIEMRKDLLGKTKLSANDFRYVNIVD